MNANRESIKKIRYTNKKIRYTNRAGGYNNNIEKILCTKLKAWEHEHEYRFIKKTEETEGNKIVIGDIKAIYF